LKSKGKKKREQSDEGIFMELMLVEKKKVAWPIWSFFCWINFWDFLHGDCFDFGYIQQFSSCHVCV